MNGSILTKIQNGGLQLSLLCDTLEETQAVKNSVGNRVRIVIGECTGVVICPMGLGHVLPQ